jgi:hypothetical protein
MNEIRAGYGRGGPVFPIERGRPCPECNGVIPAEGEQYMVRGMQYCSGTCLTNAYRRQDRSTIRPSDLDIIDC